MPRESPTRSGSPASTRPRTLRPYPFSVPQIHSLPQLDVNVPIAFLVERLRAVVSLRDDDRLPWITSSVPDNGCGAARGGTIDDLVPAQWAPIGPGPPLVSDEIADVLAA